MNTAPHICPSCQQANNCALAAKQPAEQCWCLEIAVVKNLASTSYCLCKQCLEAQQGDE